MEPNINPDLPTKLSSVVEMVYQVEEYDSGLLTPLDGVTVLLISVW